MHAVELTPEQIQRYEQEQRQHRDQQLRIECLQMVTELAVAAADPDAPADVDMVVKTAQKFYNFVNGVGSASTH